ncbi:MAG: potassium-transporting ATPase potassium-binding subunit [Actinomycetota bacterium]|jgi:K+-transporting ATPase ATPase A chain|nr:potassium-transporting ATPase potassium-binding subunit [Actinomycetota bacterium]
MSASAWAQILVLLVLLAISTPLLGSYMAKVYGGGKAPGDRVFGPVERVIYRACGIDEKGEQRWQTYATSLLAFSFASVVVLYAQIRLQGHLPLNPDGFQGPKATLSFNTAVSFLTNTNWQNYSGESTMSHLTQMSGLAVHNFVSAAAGAAVAVALIRGLTRRRTHTLGNFWVDLVRTTTRILLPLSFVFALVLVSQGAVQNFHAAKSVTTVSGQTQSLPGGPIASQEAIKQIGENGGGPYNANSAHPYENPNPITNMLQIWMLLAIPFAFPWMFGKMAGDLKQGIAVLSAMFVLWFAISLVAMIFETGGNRQLNRVGVTQTSTAIQSGGNMEGKETRFGTAASGLFAGSTTGTSTGAVNSTHDSYTPIGGAAPLVNIMLGEVDPGGTGSGLYGMLLFALLSVFIAGLMVGRTPEYLGKKIQGAEMKLVVLYILFVPLVILLFTGISVVMHSSLNSLANNGPHGLTEMTYAFTSQANNNGSAFGGLTGNTNWFNITGGISMLVGRFLLMIPVLAIAGSLGRKQPTPATAGTFPTNTGLFATLLTGVVVIVVGLTYFPVIALGPVVEHLVGKF